MNFALNPSLEHIALVKVVAALWNQNDIRALIRNFSYPISRCERIKEWQKIEDKVLEKVRQLPQPELLNKKVCGCIRPIGLEILKWMQNHLKDNNFGLHLPGEFIFTSHGTVDVQKTAELLIKDENLSIETRYRFACMCCFEDHIQKLWYKLPDGSKRKFYSQKGPDHINEHLFVKFFSYAVKGELNQLDSMSENKYNEGLFVYMFKQATRNSNKLATEYFFTHLTPIERDTYLVGLAKAVADRTSVPYSVEILFFLFSQMSQEQQISVLIKKPYEMLLCILDWPWQNLFVKTVKRLYGYLPQSFFENALQKMIQKVMDGFQDCSYQKIFSELWMQLPVGNRYYIINQCFSGSLLSNLNQCFSGGLLTNLFKIKDKENIALILKDATPQLKKEIIFKNQGIIICQNLIDKGELDLLELFIQNCITTKEEIMKLKEIFDESPDWVLTCGNNSNWYKYFCFIDNLICKYDKRKSEEETNCSSVKKFCNTKSNK